MKTTIKLSLPIYMVLVGIFFSGIIVFISQEFIAQNVGSDLDVKISCLSIFLFSNTIYLEKSLNNAEVFYLLPLRCKKRELIIRFFVKYLFVIILFTVAYILYFWKKQDCIIVNETEIGLFIKSLFCVVCSIFLWSNLTCFFVQKLGNIWSGMVVTIIGWYFMNTSLATKIPAYINVFSNSLTTTKGEWAKGWETGKLFALLIGAVFFVYNFVVRVEKGDRYGN